MVFLWAIWPTWLFSMTGCTHFSDWFLYFPVLFILIFWIPYHNTPTSKPHVPQIHFSLFLFQKTLKSTFVWLIYLNILYSIKSFNTVWLSWFLNFDVRPPFLKFYPFPETRSFPFSVVRHGLMNPSLFPSTLSRLFSMLSNVPLLFVCLCLERKISFQFFLAAPQWKQEVDMHKLTAQNDQSFTVFFCLFFFQNIIFFAGKRLQKVFTLIYNHFISNSKYFLGLVFLPQSLQAFDIIC